MYITLQNMAAKDKYISVVTLNPQSGALNLKPCKVESLLWGYQMAKVIGAVRAEDLSRGAVGA